MNLIEELRWRGMIQDIMPGTEEQLNKEMTAAYDILSNPEKRKQYDSSRSFNSFFSGKQYSSSGSSGYQRQYSNTYSNPRDDFFKNFENMFMTSFLQLIIENLSPIKASYINGGWIEIDSVEDLEKYYKNKNLLTLNFD